MLTLTAPGSGHSLAHLLGLCVASRPLSEERAMAISWLRREIAACGDATLTDVELVPPVTAGDLVRVCACEVRL